MTVEDVQNDPAVPDAATLLQGIHAVLAVPLLREDKVVGGMVIRRRREGAFSEETVSLMQTFAAQSVLAIENARLSRNRATPAPPPKWRCPISAAPRTAWCNRRKWLPSASSPPASPTKSRTPSTSSTIFPASPPNSLMNSTKPSLP